ncbi:MAG: hypothetical protein KF729_02770 [Sandaracinaceae bacterium]|nr:hypothetical protein [Sandaracinaceae bacterium]
MIASPAHADAPHGTEAAATRPLTGDPFARALTESGEVVLEDDDGEIAQRSRRSRARARARARRRAEERGRRDPVERTSRYEDDEDDDAFGDDEDDDDAYRRRARERRRVTREPEERARESREDRAARRRLERRFSDPDVRPPPTVDVHVGARVEGRLARFETGDGNVHRNDVAYPTLGGVIRARPLNHQPGIERGLELRGSFHHAVGLRSRNTLTDEAVETSFWHLYLDVGMSFEVDATVQLGLGFGFGFDSFGFGAQSLVVVPSAEYPYLRPHLRGRFQLSDELAVLEIEIGYRGTLGRGALSEHFGRDGETQGFDLVGRLGGSFDIGLSYAIEAGLGAYFHFFQGEASTAPARSGTDVGLYLGAQFGYAFR